MRPAPPSTRPRARATAALATVACLALFSILLGAPAHADGEASESTLFCLGTAHSTYTPGLKFVDQNVTTTVQYQYGPDVDCVTDADGITSGSRTATGTAINHCVDPVVAVTGISGITWNDGTTTTYTFTSYGIQAVLATTFILNGTVTAGRFLGRSIHREVIVLNADVTGSCLAEDGLTAMDGTLVLTIGPN